MTASKNLKEPWTYDISSLIGRHPKCCQETEDKNHQGNGTGIKRQSHNRHVDLNLGLHVPLHHRTFHWGKRDDKWSFLYYCSRFRGHHTECNISNKIAEGLMFYSIPEKVTCYKKDGTSNNTTAVADAGLTHIQCFAHLLNLAVNDALSALTSIEPLQKKVSDLVSHIHWSTAATEDFESCQLHLKSMTPKKLIGDIKTWLNSVFFMKQFVRLSYPSLCQHWDRNGI